MNSVLFGVSVFFMAAWTVMAALGSESADVYLWLSAISALWAILVAIEKGNQGEDK